jgi:2-iminobutanoate/2-iminopropanoate deaminase
MKKISVLNFLMIVFLALFLFSCKEGGDNEAAKIITSSNAPKPIGPYSQAVLTDDFLFISGQLAMDPATGKLDTTDITNQTKRVMENLKAVLNEAGMDFKNVVKTSIFLTDMSNFPKVNEVYSSYFKDNFPTRETVQVAALPKNGTIEISMIAHK